jgi:hypothetical protein
VIVSFAMAMDVASSMFKVRRGECGHKYAERHLAGFGVAARRPGESGEAFLAPGAAGRRRGRIASWWQLPLWVPPWGDPGARAAVWIAPAAGPYPKAIDDTSWRRTTPLTAEVAPDVGATSLL